MLAMQDMLVILLCTPASRAKRGWPGIGIQTEWLSSIIELQDTHSLLDKLHILDCASLPEIVQRAGVANPVINTLLIFHDILPLPPTCISLHKSTLTCIECVVGSDIG